MSGGEKVSFTKWKTSISASRKQITLLIALAIFVITVATYIAPHQGALSSSTELQSDELSKANPRYD